MELAPHSVSPLAWLPSRSCCRRFKATAVTTTHPLVMLSLSLADFSGDSQRLLRRQHQLQLKVARQMTSASRLFPKRNRRDPKLLPIQARPFLETSNVVVSWHNLAK